MDNFIVSARKYRPATFDTVVGQQHITNTLKNAIKNKHLAQAFLFCGPRGVGKTTCARILAKTINCFHVTEGTEACDQCESCLSFNSGQSLNVYELDAASNNSVEDIRNLIDQVRFAPQLGNFKVYIIDEVHMLSNQAFNAFLKTLEEPPAHAIFILATTEKHKIIPTILSRCQIFDFNRIQVEDIATHLGFIAKKENIQAEEDALHIIGQKADGALRDALSMFDQIVSFAGNNISYKAVIDNLNILDYDYYFKLTDFLLEEKISESLLLYNEVLHNGFDGHNFISGLGEHLRNLLVSKDASTLQLLEVGKSIRDKYQTQSQKCNLFFLIDALKITSKTDIQYKSSKNQRLLVELALLELCSLLRQQAEKKNDQPSLSQAETKPAPAVVPVINQNTAASPALPIETPNIPAEPFQKKAVAPALPGMLNLNSLIKKEAVATPVVDELGTKIKESLPEEPFSEQDLAKVWNSYLQILNSQEKVTIYNVIFNCKYVLAANNRIEVTLDNIIQENTLKEEKQDLMDYLRKELKNYAVDLVVVIDRTATESQIKLMNTGEKFKRMVEINPLLLKLSQSLDLEI